MLSFLSLCLSMSAFALASSITPGPVNLVALNTGARHGVRASLPHITGATTGFTVLLLCAGLGVQGVLHQWPGLSDGIRFAGIAFLGYMAIKLAFDKGHLHPAAARRTPGFWHGAALQWLNPKAWLASIAGMGAFAAEPQLDRVLLFATLYYLICYASILCWAWAGSHLRPYLQQASRVRTFNRLMAALLLGCALYLLPG